MPTRVVLVLSFCAVLAIAIVTAATAAPVARTTSLVSSPTGVPDPDSDDVDFRQASADGSRVFLATTQKLTSDDTDTGRQDIYERAGGVTTLLSKPTGVADPDTDDVSLDGASADGSRVFLETTQKMTGDDGDSARTDIYERSGGTTSLVSGPTGVPDSDLGDANFRGVSADGGHLFFESADKLSADDTDTSTFDVYEHSAGVTTLVSAPTGVADPGSVGAQFGGASADGTRIFFDALGKLSTDDTDTGKQDVYERSGGTTTLVSKPTGVADPDSGNGAFAGTSDDGSRVFFSTSEELTSGDSDGAEQDVYERASGTTTLVSAPTGVADPNSDSVFFDGASDDGSRVFFDTSQKLTGDDGDSDRRDTYQRSAGTTTLESGPTGVADPDTSSHDFVGISVDGSHVFFETEEALTAADGDTDRLDAYEHSGGETKLVSAPTGVADPDDDDADFGGWSEDGSRVFFQTDQQLTADDGNSDDGDIYERSEGATRLVSKPNGVADPTSGFAHFEGASADGSRVFFRSDQKLTGDDGDSAFRDVFMAADTTAPQTTITAGPAGTTSDSTPSFSFSSNEAGATFQCKVDGGAFVSCASPKTLAALTNGPHSLQVRARDNVGNVDASPAIRGFTVDTTLAAGGGGGGGPLVTSGPTTKQIKAALGGDLKAAARVLKRLGIRKLRERRAGKVKKVDALRAGTVRITGVARHVKVLSGRRRFTKAGKGTLKLKLTRKGRRLLRHGRRLRITLRASFTDARGKKTSAKPRKVTIRRKR